MLWTAACVSAHASTQSLDESFKSILPLQNLHHSNLHYRTSLPKKTLMGNVAWNSREIYSAKKPLHVCTPFSILVMTQTSVLMLWAEDPYMADRGKKPQLILNFGILKVNCSLHKEKNSLQQLQQTCQWNLKLIIWDKLLTLNISALKLMCTVAVFWKVRSTPGWMEASPVSAPHLTSVPWPTHLSYGQNKVLLQPPPLWITSPSRCVHKTQYTKQRVAEKSTPDSSVLVVQRRLNQH